MGKYARIAKSDFQFIPSGFGHYKVTYTSPNTGKKWKATLTSVELEFVLYADKPKVTDLDALKWYCKHYGTKLN